ncbi:MAG: signal peptidase I [Candidatus Hydrogenedentes bacterium]|nr:signal peptidase I [Candidatus Hydrogenedentota bacterium]
MNQTSAPGPEGQGRRPMALRVVESVVGPLTVRNGLSWLVLALAVLTVWWLLFQPFVIPTDSMYPTLNGDERFLRGDRIFVNKLIYGPRIPFTSTRLWRFKDPQRWDIVVFRPVEKDAPHPVLIKRIVGMPGERIQIKDGSVWANGQRLEPPPELRDVLHYTRYLGPGDEELMKFALLLAVRSGNAATAELKNMTDGQLLALTGEELKRLYDGLPEWLRKVAQTNFEQQRINPLKYGILPDDAYSVVPPDCYLVLGDNSPNSQDGRYFGWVPNGHILGRASCTFWPIGRARDFTGFWHARPGKAVLYGVPALIVAVEVIWRLRRKKQVQRPN